MEELQTFYIIGYRIVYANDEEDYSEERVTDFIDAEDESAAQDEFHSRHGYEVEISCVRAQA